MLVKAWLADAYQRLRDAQIDEYQTESHWILEDILHLSPSERMNRSDQALTQVQISALNEIIDQRIKHIPLAYLLKKWSFWDFEVITDQRALIPRSDTECLVEKALAILNHKRKSGQHQLKAIEVGVGTGCISIALSKNIANLEILGLDISLDALSLAKENIDLHHLQNRIQLGHSDLLMIKSAYPKLDQKLDLPQNIDLLISNPPYIQTKVIDTLMSEVKDFEPKLALDGGEDGLDLIRIMLKQAKNILAKGAYLMFEIGYDQGDALRELLAQENYQSIEIIKDYQGQDRVAMGVYQGDQKI
jgi:release factor glutamine methyltransferase